MTAVQNQELRMAAYRAPSLFQPHRARQALRDAHEGKISPLIGLYLGLSSVPTARYIAPLGFDAVFIDWEHSSCNVETMTTMVHDISFMSEGRTIPFVRIPGHEHAAVGYALDAGASIIVPQVNTVAEAKHVVSSTKYGAKCGGTRSAPPYRLIQGITDTPIDKTKSIHENQNDQAAIVIQIESLEGLNNLDSILSEVPEIDAVWFGIIDCRVSMGLRWESGVVPTEPEWQEALAKFGNIMRKHNKPCAGFALGPPEKMRAMGEGKSLVFVAVDVLALLSIVADLENAHQVFVPAN
ncbi:hypothetical protein EYZ11_009354 [Aspergillus tanneri]|uniref:HpcH/HpaI aldolase/citrate lyase domain-containing protein n=1 Tax=Aspergillus tanneri TaxID=1220188 RepID=A0A4S3J839_9EURO|nr:uncharacterized protein ATNIH1004_008640 [Aspergillus tanneri]KAA8644436.1 hypothetical protein ATNIH1004_008640 [Aspergillus tanneri]THC91186.1 hypothetical protein EYZ11_009354 [Aspergillus tanneri]